VPTLAALACALVVAAIARQRHAAGAVVDSALVRVGAFVAGISALLLSYAVLFGCLVAVSFFLEREAHLGVATTGLELSALPLALAALAPFGGLIRDRAGPRLPIGLGMAVTAAGMGLLALSSSRHGLTVVALAVAGAGLGLFIPAITAATMGAAPAQRGGAAGGLLNMARGTGAALGVSTTSLVFAAGRGLITISVLLLAAAVAAGVIGVAGTGSGSRSPQPSIL
jgi:MFS family permease